MRATMVNSCQSPERLAPLLILKSGTLSGRLIGRVRMPARTGSNMNSIAPSSGVSRRALLSALALLAALSAPLVSFSALAQTAIAGAGDLLPSWSDGPAKQAILDFVL